MHGIKHIVSCRCMLPQFKNRKDPTMHKFVVFSILDDNDTVQIDYAQCNNCGIVHKIIDLCKSEILHGQEDLSSFISIQDIKLMIPSDLSSVLENYSCDLPTWQQAHFIFANKKWGDKIILNRDNLEDEIKGKILIIEESNKFKIESFIESL